MAGSQAAAIASISSFHFDSRNWQHTTVNAHAVRAELLGAHARVGLVDWTDAHRAQACHKGRCNLRAAAGATGA